jgi:PAS domain S-box-containing protein
MRRGAYFQVLPEARDLLIEWMDNGILVLDRDGMIIDANPAAASLCHKPASELIGQSFPKLCPQMSTVLDQSPKQETIQTEIMYSLGEKTQWLDVRITPLYKNTQDFSGYMLEMQDVSRRQLAEEALRESEQRYRQVIDGMIEGVVVQDADGAIIACNPNAELILNVPRVEMLEQKSTFAIWQSIRDDGSLLRGEEHPSMIALSTGMRQANVTMGLYLPDGNLRWLLINSQPLIKVNEKKPYAVVSTFVDITEDRRTEQTLRDSENMFRSLLESAPVAIIISDEVGHIQLMNASAEQLFGYSRAELQGEIIEKLIPNVSRTSISPTYYFQGITQPPNGSESRIGRSAERWL